MTKKLSYYTVDRQHPSPGFYEWLLGIGMSTLLGIGLCMWLLPEHWNILGSAAWTLLHVIFALVILKSEDSMQGATVFHGHPQEWLEASESEDSET